MVVLDQVKHPFPPGGGGESGDPLHGNQFGGQKNLGASRPKKKMAKILPLAGDPRGLGHSQGRGAPAELPTLPPLSPRVQPTVSLSPFPGFVFSLA